MEIFFCVFIVAVTSLSTILLFRHLCAKVWFYWYVKQHPWVHPNWICAWRTILALIGVLILIEFPGRAGFYVALVIYAASASLDAVDGMVARKCDQETEFGKWLDPFCDKVSYLTPIAIFALNDLLYLPLVILLFASELFGQFIVREILCNRNRSVEAIPVGKIKAVFCFLEVFNCSLVSIDIAPLLPNIVLSVCLILAIASALFKLYPVLELSFSEKIVAKVRGYVG